MRKVWPRPDYPRAVSWWTLRAFSLVQGTGAITLAYLIWRARGSVTFDSALNASMAETVLLGIGGVLALGLSIPFVKLTEWRWAVTGSTISTAMLARAADLLWNHTDFAGRVEIRMTLWAVMGISTLASWALIGSIAGSNPLTGDPKEREDDQPFSG